MIVVTMMDRQFAQVSVGEFATAAAADPGIDLEGLFPVALRAFFSVAAGLGHYPVQLARVARFHTALCNSLRGESPSSPGSRSSKRGVQRCSVRTLAHALEPVPLSGWYAKLSLGSAHVLLMMPAQPGR